MFCHVVYSVFYKQADDFYSVFYKHGRITIVGIKKNDAIRYWHFLKHATNQDPLFENMKIIRQTFYSVFIIQVLPWDEINIL
jgi:hypothetical protein